jgi:hypothetical protein
LTIVPAIIGSGHGQKRSRRRELTIAALIAHPTVKAAAKAAGIAEITLHRWLKEPGFAADYQAARARVLETAAEQLRAGTLAAVDVLREIAANKRAPSSSRVQAARSFLEATSLLRGTAVTVNNAVPLPVNLEGINAAIIESLREMLATDRRLRQTMREMIAEFEAEENETLPN